MTRRAKLFLPRSRVGSSLPGMRRAQSLRHMTLSFLSWESRLVSGRLPMQASALLQRGTPRAFAKICQKGYCSAMSTMNISLPDSLKDFIDEQVDQRGFGTSSEYIRELIRKEQERLQLRGLLLAGASSAPTKPVDGAYFDGLRKKVRAIKPGARR
jgi:antitoxin ParD1/3/4